MNREFGQWIPSETWKMPTSLVASRFIQHNPGNFQAPSCQDPPASFPTHTHSLTTLDPGNPATRAQDFRQISLNQDQRNVEFGPDTRRRRKSPFHADGPKTWAGQRRQNDRNKTG
jgi:hypothetical protein